MKSLSKVFVVSTLAYMFTAASLFGRPIGDPHDPGNGPIDDAIDCMADTKVHYFRASPSTVNPFRSTTLSWHVTIPQGCPVSLKVAGVKVDPRGSKSYTPISRSSHASLTATTLGGASATLSRVLVGVNMNDCDTTEVFLSQVESQFLEILNDYIENTDKIYSKGDASIDISSRGLSIRQVLGVDILGPNPTLTLDMSLRFISRNGVVYPSWAKFKPTTSSYLPDDIINSKVYDKQASILAGIRRALNQRFTILLDTIYGTPRSERIFELNAHDDYFEISICR